jgi:catechol 2,3-dioxygenase-like lactoylglutathione lyase family enzyme
LRSRRVRRRVAKVLAKEEGDGVGMPPGQEAEARRFYGHLLGLRETMKPPEVRGGVWFSTDAGLFKVEPRADFKPANDKPQARFRVDKAEALRMALDKARYRHYDAPHVVGTRGFYAHDPWGNRIELRERPN